MLPSPARRCSPGREFRVENSHKRGQSVDCELRCKSKDDDLTLFTDMQTKEKNNLILLSNEDFDDSLAKLKCTTDYPFGMTTHIRRGSNDLLNADGEKNDYDWLLTPPDTPLFPYLDDDDPPPANLSASRGRLRSQGMAVPRSSMSEKSQRSSRSSASPHRLSPSPRSTNTTIQSRGRSPSAVQSSSAHVARAATPSRRSPTPNKPSSPTPRSSTPQFRRTSIDSSLQTSSSARRGTSPMKGSRGSSASPKLQGWQSNIPGFSSDPPPNLRTSLSDRPNSYSRGSSPASRNGRARQSMSPTTSRSASSSHSYDPDYVSPQSKDSTASFADEDVDSLPSVSMGSSPSPVGRKNGAFTSNKSMGFSRKPSRTVMTNSTPKRSLDSTLQQMDQHKTTQNMFRPLLSSAPISSFYIGKASAMHRPVFSRNSSLTTSSNASSELGASVAPEHEGTNHGTTYNAGEWDRISDSLLHEEGFVFEKMDDIKEDIMHDLVSEKSLDGHVDFDMNIAKGIKLDDSQKSCSLAESVVHPLPQDSSYDQFGCLVDNRYVRTCSICRKTFTLMESSDPSFNICEECTKKADLSDLVSTRNVLLSSHKENVPLFIVSNAIDGSSSELRLVAGHPGISEETNDKDMTWKLVGNSEQFASQLDSYPEALDCLQGSCAQLVTTDQKCHDPQLEVWQSSSPKDLEESSSLQLASSEREHHAYEMGAKQMVDVSDNDHRSLQSQSVRSNSSLKIDNSEGTGMSVLLLKQSSSNKGPLVQTRAFTASNLQYDDPTYARDNINVVKPNISRSSSSVSSIDTGLPRQIEVHVHRQPSTTRGDSDCPHDLIAVSHNPAASSEISLRDVVEKPGHDHLAESEKSNHANFLRCGSVEKDRDRVPFEEIECNDRHFSSMVGNSIGDSSQTTASMQIDGLSESSTVAEGASKMNYSVTMLQTGLDFLCHDDTEVEQSRCIVADKDSFADTALQVAIHNDGESSDGTQRSSSSASLDIPTNGSMECMKMESKDYEDSAAHVETSHSRSHSLMSEKELSAPAIDHEEDIAAAKESAVVIEGSLGQKPRSLTLTEATDTILFCSSIIHDLAYKAASIGIEKGDSSSSKFAQPTVTIPDKHVSHQREQPGVLNKRTTKPQRVRRKTAETNIEVQESEPLKSEKPHDSPKPDPVPHREVETPKPLAKPPSKPLFKCNCTIM